ncbi:hypothetical protein ACQEWB_14920 [Streptomyces sp. CA-249302]|uniref:hypothetical protein n=1 Tax=Streptomyces sp. CA-249302 TaxID=3240058 RepID=UPI003D89B8CD
MCAVVIGDIAIVVAAWIGIDRVCGDKGTVASILTAAFTAVSTMTTAYFGIRAVSNTAQRAIEPKQSGNSGPTP